MSAPAIAGSATMTLPSEDGRRPGAERPGHGERLLVVDDEVDIADLLRAGLRFVGYDVRVAHSGAEALAVTDEFRPQLVLMDVMLPDISGFELCRQVRQVRDPIGIVFLTARNRTEDAIAGLGAGGDDYISKPFSLDEVVARVRAVLRRLEPLWADRTSPRASRDDGVLRLADLELDEERHEVRRANAIIDLSPTEFALLRFLLENAGRVLSRAQILSHVWSYEFAGETSIVDSYVSYLRKKIDCFDPPLIHTVRGIGYALRVGR